MSSSPSARRGPETETHGRERSPHRCARPLARPHRRGLIRTVPYYSEPMPNASHGRSAGFLGPIPCARRQRRERSRAFSRRSSGVSRFVRCLRGAARRHHENIFAAVTSRPPRQRSPSAPAFADPALSPPSLAAIAGLSTLALAGRSEVPSCAPPAVLGITRMGGIAEVFSNEKPNGRNAGQRNGGKFPPFPARQMTEANSKIARSCAGGQLRIARAGGRPNFSRVRESPWRGRPMAPMRKKKLRGGGRRRGRCGGARGRAIAFYPRG